MTISDMSPEPPAAAIPAYALRLPPVVVVVGGSGEIGGAIAATLSASGCATWVFDVKEPPSELDAQFVAVDVVDEDAVCRAFRDTLGPGSGEGGAAVIYAVGVSDPMPVTELPLDTWERVMRVNSTGGFLVAKHAISWLVCRPWSRLVFISSMSSFVANRGRHNAHYCASKAALNGMTQQLAATYADQGLTVNAVLPGYVRTAMVTNHWPPSEVAALDAMIPTGRLARPEEIVAPVMMLIAEESSYVNGAMLVVDGAYTRW
jgi:gluconate 5-dehydrogenase